MSELVADFVLKRLREWGIHRIYGYPGDGICGGERVWPFPDQIVQHATVPSLADLLA